MCCLAAILTTPRYNTYFVGFVASVLWLDQAIFYGLQYWENTLMTEE